MQRFNVIFRKYILFWALLAMIVGYLTGKFNPKRISSLSLFITPLLFIMVFVMVLPSQLSNIIKLKNYIFPMALSFILFIISPFIAYLVSSIIPKEFRFLTTGIIIASTVPPDAMLSAWAGFLEADILLTLIIQSSMFILWIFLVPLGLSLFFGGTKYFSMLLLIKNLILLIVIPFAIAITIKIFLQKRLTEDVRKNIRITLSSISSIIEMFIILISVALHAQIISDNPILIIWGFFTSALYYSVIFITAIIITRVVQINWQSSIPLIYENGTKNLPIAMVVALTSFEGKAVLGVAACILTQFPVAALFYSAMSKLHHKI